MGYYPPVGFHFKVEFSNAPNKSDICFQEVGGLTAELGVEQLPVGGENRFTFRLPSKASYQNLVLKRGYLTDSKLIKWIQDAIENFSFKPADITVSLLNEKNEPSASWEFIQAYPVKWVISDFKASENSLVVETIELVYQYFRKTK